LVLGGAGLMLAIDLIEPLGSETLIHGHIADGPETQMVLRIGGVITSYETVSVGIPGERVHIFDEKTGGRI
jgi:sn-glycerol 3-phosphate transport system ATP-binding protein